MFFPVLYFIYAVFLALIGQGLPNGHLTVDMIYTVLLSAPLLLYLYIWLRVMNQNNDI